MTTPHWPTVAAAIALLAASSAASAELEPIGPAVPTGSFVQVFQESGSGPFNYIVFEMTSSAFETPTLTDFSAPGWHEIYSDGTTAIAVGPSVSAMTWEVHFEADLEDDLDFRYAVYNGAVPITDALATRSNGFWVPLPFPADPNGPLPRAFDAALVLNAVDECYEVGDVLTVDINMLSAALPVVGGQFFLQYDPAVLQFQDAVPGASPFIVEIYQDDLIPGLLDYSVGILGGGSGTDVDSRMASVSFEILQDVCEASGLVHFRLHSPPTRLTDDDGFSIEPALIDLGSITADSTAPSLTMPADITVECGTSTDAVATGVATAMDACDPAPEVSFADVISSGACAQAMTITRTWTAVDACGNSASMDQIITVEDSTPPLITCPLDMTTSPDLGFCSALLNVGAAAASDNCDEEPVVIGLRDDGMGLSDPYPSGTTEITWTATDACGNSSFCIQYVTVESATGLVVDVELEGISAGTVSRCITFELTGNSGSDIVSHTLTFNSGLAIGAVVDIPCGDWDCITARDALHTLASQTMLGQSGGQYTASFLGGDQLAGGDLNDDNLVDILDFGVFVWQYSDSPNYGTGDTPCGTAFPHADINGDGLVTTHDFTYLQTHFLEFGESCGGGRAIAGGGRSAGGHLVPSRWAPPQPRERIAVRDLPRLRLSHLRLADLDGDGWIDAGDIAQFMMQP